MWAVPLIIIVPATSAAFPAAPTGGGGGGGGRYIFKVIDQSTRWLEGIPMKNLEGTTAADALVVGWICRFGVPQTDHSMYLTNLGSSAMQQT